MLKELGFKRIDGTREGYILEDLETAVPLIKSLQKEEQKDKEWDIPTRRTEIS